MKRGKDIIFLSAIFLMYVSALFFLLQQFVSCQELYAELIDMLDPMPISVIYESWEGGEK